MGGGSYDRDVGSSSSSSGFSYGGGSDDFSYGSTSSSRAKMDMGAREADPSTSSLDRIVQSDRQSPIVIGLDGTGSNIEFARIVYDKAPMLHGQIEQQGYLKDFDICFSIIGDATCDRAPLQVCDFAYGIDLDEQLKKLWLEGGGGSDITESYELGAYFFANKCKMPNATMPFMFFIADEAPYSKLDKYLIERNIGDSVSQNLNSSDIFGKLIEKFQGNVFMLHNPYGGTKHPRNHVTERVREAWIDAFGSTYMQHIIPIREEKSVVDVILGTIAMVSGARNMTSYTKDLATRGQSDSRIDHVKSSLYNLSKSVVPYVGAKLPKKNSDGTISKTGKDNKDSKNSGAKRL